MDFNRWRVQIISDPYIYLLLILGFYKGVSCSSCIDYSLIDTSIIFLFKTLYIDAASRGVSDTWNTDITVLKRCSWLIVTRRRKWNWKVFARPGLENFNDENPLKGLICVGRGDRLALQDRKSVV